MTNTINQLFELAMLERKYNEYNVGVELECLQLSIADYTLNGLVYAIETSIHLYDLD